MLISSKHKNEKIILGLLSYTFDDEKVTMAEMTALLESYRENPNFDILLYRDEESDNFIGLVCVERNAKVVGDLEEASLTLIIHRIAVVPSFRDEGVGYRMYESLRQMYPQATVIGAMNTVDVLAKWSMKYNQPPQIERDGEWMGD